MPFPPPHLDLVPKLPNILSKFGCCNHTSTEWKGWDPDNQVNLHYNSTMSKDWSKQHFQNDIGESRITTLRSTISPTIHKPESIASSKDLASKGGSTDLTILDYFIQGFASSNPSTLCHPPPFLQSFCMNWISLKLTPVISTPNPPTFNCHMEIQISSAWMWSSIAVSFFFFLITWSSIAISRNRIPLF